MTQGTHRTTRLSLARFSSPERPQWLARSAALLNAAELEHIAGIRDPDTRTQHAVGRALVRLIGAQALGCGPAAVKVGITGTGKPWLPELPGLQVNVSHTRRIVAVASTSVAPLGVDVELPTALAVHPRRLAQRLFASSEAHALRDLSEAELADGFSSAWTIKEAVGKALGVGVIPALSQVVVDIGKQGVELVSVGGAPAAGAWSLHQLTAPGGEEKIAVAVRAPGVGLEPVSMLTLEQFARAVSDHGETAQTPASL